MPDIGQYPRGRGMGCPRLCPDIRESVGRLLEAQRPDRVVKDVAKRGQQPREVVNNRVEWVHSDHLLPVAVVQYPLGYPLPSGLPYFSGFFFMFR